MESAEYKKTEFNGNLIRQTFLITQLPIVKSKFKATEWKAFVKEETKKPANQVAKLMRQRNSCFFVKHVKDKKDIPV